MQNNKKALSNITYTLENKYNKAKLTSEISTCPLLENEPSADGPAYQSPYCSSSSNQNKAVLFEKSLKYSFSDMKTYMSYNACSPYYSCTVKTLYMDTA